MIIPAPAGNTQEICTIIAQKPDHPRARGTRCRARCGHRRLRIIPAPARNRAASPGWSGSGPDHPRARGEHHKGGVVFLGGDGSSPRPRGTLYQRGRAAERQRIIPAPAGNTDRGSPCASPRPDHPRARGEHQPWRRSHSPTIGSSPRPRGTPLEAIGLACAERIIPAHARNTWPARSARAFSTDHPCVRWEHANVAKYSDVVTGSSPRLRGNTGMWKPLLTICAGHPRAREEQVAVRAVRNLHWIIPARAGNTARRRLPASGPAGHPRTRGEHLPCSAYCTPSTGSSPRAGNTLRACS